MEEKLYTHLPMCLNLGDHHRLETHIGWSDVFRDTETGEIRIEIRLDAEASEQLKALHEIFNIKAIGFAGIARKPLVMDYLQFVAYLESRPEGMSPLARVASMENPPSEAGTWLLRWVRSLNPRR